MSSNIIKTIAIQGLYEQSVNNFKIIMDTIEKVSNYSWYNGIEFFHDGTWREYSKIKHCLKRKGLESIFLAGYPIKTQNLDIGAMDENARLKAVEAIKHWIDVAYYLGSKKILILSGPVVEEDRQKAYSNTIESLRQLCEYADSKAKDHRLEITLEFFNDKGEPYLLIGPVSKTVEIAQSICNQYDNFGITFDISHVVQLGEDIEKSLAKLYKYTNHFHIANCVTKDSRSEFFGDKHPPFGMEGSDISEQEICLFLDVLKKHFGINDCITIGAEVIAPKGFNPDCLLHDITHTFKRCMTHVFNGSTTNSVKI